MRKRFIMLIAVMLILSVPVCAAARVVLFQKQTVVVSFDGTTAECQIRVKCSSDVESITANVTLYYEDSAGRLILSKTWGEETVSGNTYSFSEYAYNRTAGRTYVLEAVVTATDSDGVEETITLTDEEVC